jgi:hypothetical protein
MLNSYLCLCLSLPNCLLPSGFPTNMFYAFLISALHSTFPACIAELCTKIKHRKVTYFANVFFANLNFSMALMSVEEMGITEICR